MEPIEERLNRIESMLSHWSSGRRSRSFTRPRSSPGWSDAKPSPAANTAASVAYGH